MFSSLVMALAGIILSIPLGKDGLLIAASSVLILLIYDSKLKKTPLIGNIAVAFLGGLAFIYGGVAAGNAENTTLPAVFAGLFHLSREMIKDAEDYRGDMLAGVRTIATVYGVRVASGLSTFVMMILAFILMIPFIYKDFGVIYLMMILACVYPVLGVSIKLVSRHEQKNFSRASNLLKAGMPLGILALLAGFQGW
jgi:geranylgeranylglycerol-phosphate geranylgeranyltransferase